MFQEPYYTEEERVQRIWDKENCVQLINRHSFYYSNDQRREELDDLWVQEPQNKETASLAYNNGYYVGMAEVARHYVGDRLAQRMERLKAYEGRVEATEANLGYGCSAMHTSTTPLVYIADDGRTARYLGYQLGYQANGKPDGDADAFFEFGLMFADLKKENGVWKIWHLVLEHDHTVEVGTAYADVPVLRPEEEDPLRPDWGDPTVKQDVYQPLFGWEYIWQDMPRPYDTYNEKESYGPNGDLGKPYYLRERR